MLFFCKLVSLPSVCCRFQDWNTYAKSSDVFFRAASTFVCAQTAAISAGYASYPFDTVRRRLQMQSEKPQVRPLRAACCREWFIPSLLKPPSPAHNSG